MITYCTNIHAGERWEDVFSTIRTHLPIVKKAVSPGAPFPIGLRLGNLAATEMDEAAASAFQEWCRENDFFVPTINGFPYGIFHGAPVKENVYLPDWRSPERVRYTKRLAALLDRWLPEGIRGSISTVPVGFKRHIQDADYPAVRRNLIDVLEFMDGLKQKSAKEIILALEPEPACVLETMADVVGFIERLDLPGSLWAMLGVCFDCCHQAVEFEKPEESLKVLAASDIPVGKIHISSALRLQSVGSGDLERFNDPTYLHQVVIRKLGGDLHRYEDLPEALQQNRTEDDEEWRIHYHVPIFAEKMGDYDTTQAFITEVLPFVGDDTLLEIETYTWDILPRELKKETVTESIIREIQWLEDVRNAQNRCS